MPRQTRAEFEPPLPSDVLLILLSLASRPMHGYAIIQDVGARTDNAVQLQTGALYRYLHRLLRGGLITECAPPSVVAASGPPRRYYKVTASGETLLSAEVERMALLVRAAKATAGGRRPRLA